MVETYNSMFVTITFHFADLCLLRLEFTNMLEAEHVLEQDFLAPKTLTITELFCTALEAQ